MFPFPNTLKYEYDEILTAKNQVFSWVCFGSVYCKSKCFRTVAELLLGQRGATTPKKLTNGLRPPELKVWIRPYFQIMVDNIVVVNVVF